MYPTGAQPTGLLLANGVAPGAVTTVGTPIFGVTAGYKSGS